MGYRLNFCPLPLVSSAHPLCKPGVGWKWVHCTPPAGIRPCTIHPVEILQLTTKLPHVPLLVHVGPQMLPLSPIQPTCAGGHSVPGRMPALFALPLRCNASVSTPVYTEVCVGQKGKGQKVGQYGRLQGVSSSNRIIIHYHPPCPALHETVILSHPVN